MQLTLEDRTLPFKGVENLMPNVTFVCFCLQTHCCHLEMATSLDTGAFLNAFVRMAARRGWPTKILSDNGTNFMGAKKEIGNLHVVSQLDHGQLQSMTTNHSVTWYWNSLAAPHSKLVMS